MRVFLQLLQGRFIFWRKNPRVLASFLLNAAFSIIFSRKYILFCRVMDLTANPLDLFIIMGSTITTFLELSLACFFLLSDTTEIQSRNYYELLRVGPNNWLRVEMIYSLIATVIYYLFTIMITCVICCICLSGSLSTSWGEGITTLAEVKPSFAVSNFRLHFPYSEIIHNISPALTICLVLVGNVGYCYLLVIIMSWINIMFRTNYGWLVSIVFHIINYVILQNRLLFGSYFSFLDLAFPVVQYEVRHPIKPIIYMLIIAGICVALSKSVAKHSERLKL